MIAFEFVEDERESEFTMVSFSTPLPLCGALAGSTFPPRVSGMRIPGPRIERDPMSPFWRKAVLDKLQRGRAAWWLLLCFSRPIVEDI